MKKIYSSLLCFVLFSITIVAQPTLTSTNIVPSIGDNQLFYVADTNSLIDPTIGNNVVFDYTNLRGYGMTQGQFIVNPSSTPQGGTFSSATYADTSDVSANNTRYIQVFGADSIGNLGIVASIPGFGELVGQYDIDPETILKFPFNYSDNYTDNYAGSFLLGGNNTNAYGTATVVADAWGELRLPGITIDSVIRVRTTENLLTDTIKINFPVQITLDPVQITGQYINYYKPSVSKFPLLSYITGAIKQGGNIVDSTNNFISQYALPGVSINELNTEVIELDLFPNPTNKEKVTLNFNVKEKSTITVDVLNGVGQKIRTVYNKPFIIGNNKINIATNNLSSGIYFVRVTINSNSIIKKLVVK